MPSTSISNFCSNRIFERINSAGYMAEVKNRDAIERLLVAGAAYAEHCAIPAAILNRKSVVEELGHRSLGLSLLGPLHDLQSRHS
jgi:hypothetical protein